MGSASNPQKTEKRAFKRSEIHEGDEVVPAEETAMKVGCMATKERASMADSVMTISLDLKRERQKAPRFVFVPAVRALNLVCEVPQISAPTHFFFPRSKKTAFLRLSA